MEKIAKHTKPKIKWLKRIGLLIGLILLAPVILFSVGWFNRDLLIDGIQEWYRANGNGELEIGEVDATFISGFPNVGFTINEIYQSSFDSVLDKRTSVAIKKARVNIGAKDLLKGNLQFKSIAISDARIFSEVQTNKSLEDYILLKEQSQENPDPGIQLPTWLHPKLTNFSLRDVHFVAKDTMLNKFFDLELNSANGVIRSEKTRSTGNVNFEIKANDLGFNTKKGSYINGAWVSGHPEFVLNKENNMLLLPKFDMSIGKQEFKVNAEFDFTNITTYNFTLENEKTNFQQLKELLPDTLHEKLSRYDIARPLETNLSLEGKFQYGNVPFINADFSTEGNALNINDSINLNKVSFKGSLTNDFQENGMPGKPDIKVYFEDFEASLKDIQLTANNSFYQSTEEIKNLVDATVKINGSSQSLANVLKNDNFDFKGGDFSLNTHIAGDITDIEQIFDSSTGKFTMKNTRVVLKENQLQLPIELVDLNLNNESSVLNSLVVNLPNGENLVFQGNVQHTSSLLSNDPKIPAAASVTLDSDELNLNDLIGTAMEFIPKNEKKSDLKTLHETFAAIYKKFRPQFKLNLKALNYNGITLNDLDADVRLLDAETIIFDDFDFRYQGARTMLNGTVRVPDPGEASVEPIFIKVATESSGPISVFQDLFNIQLMKINKGEYAFKGNVEGNIQKFEQILNNTQGNLKLKNASFYYPNAASDIVLDSLNIAVDHSDVRIDRFKIEVGDHHPFALSGQINDFPGFLLDDVKKTGNISVDLDARFVDMDQWLKTINSMEKDSVKQDMESGKLEAVFQDAYEFHPSLNIKIDSLKYQDLITEKMNARVLFKNDSVVELEELKLKYKKSGARIVGAVTAQHIADSVFSQNPFTFDFKTEITGPNSDLNDLLKTSNFVLETGNYEFHGSYSGQARNMKIANSITGGDLAIGKSRVNVKAADLEIPVDSLHLQIKDNLATLDRLDIDLPGKSSLDIKGAIDNFSDFINNKDANESHNSSFTIRSPYLSDDDIKALLSSANLEKDTTKSGKFETSKLKKALNGINNSYYPLVRLDIDSLIISNIAVSDFGSDLGFQYNGDFMIENTSLKYRSGSIDLSLEVGVQSEENLPVTINMDAKNLALEKVVKDLDYFHNTDLENTERINGNLNYVLNATGVLKNDGSLDLNSLNGTLQLELDSLALYNFKPVMEKAFLMKEERFKHLRFRPIIQTFKVKDGEIIIPRTEIQSSALHVFVQGKLKLDEYINIWLSLPWKNLKSNDGMQLPEKTTFEDAGSKFYIQLVQDKDSDREKDQKLRTKFRLSDAKLEKSLDEE